MIYALRFMRRVAITAFGAVTPIGLDALSTWESAVAGRSGIGFIESFDASEFPVRIAGEVRGFDPSALIPAKEARRMDRNVLLAVAAAQEAWDEAGIEEFDPARVGILVGSAIGGIATIAEQQQIFLERGADRVSPFFIPSALVDTASGQIAIQLGITGPNFAPVSACATGSTAIGEGAATIVRGQADIVLAGGTEAAITPLILAGFCAMRGLVAEDVDPTLAMRPFDATRAGFVMGEGACILVLEELESAKARGATIYAEVVGYGASNDAHHLAQPEPEATGVAAMISSALTAAGVAPERVGYVNAHGTSTPLGDLAETRALRQVFGDHAYELAVSSTKSVTGHCFGAAGAVEAMMCARALHHQVLPPTINYRNPDPELDLDYVPERGAAGRRPRVRDLERDGPRRPQRLRPARPLRRLATGEAGDRLQPVVRASPHRSRRAPPAPRSPHPPTRAPPRRAGSARSDTRSRPSRPPSPPGSRSPSPRPPRTRSAATPSRRAASRYTSGLGFPRGTSSDDTVATKQSAMPAVSSTASISGRFEDDATASGYDAASERTASTAPSSNGSSP